VGLVRRVTLDLELVAPGGAVTGEPTEVDVDRVVVGVTDTVVFCELEFSEPSLIVIDAGGIRTVVEDVGAVVALVGSAVIVAFVVLFRILSKTVVDSVEDIGFTVEVKILGSGTELTVDVDDIEGIGGIETDVIIEDVEGEVVDVA